MCIYIDIIVVLLDSSYFMLSFMDDIMGFSAMVMDDIVTNEHCCNE